jgi:predicted Zn-dependent peptidase
MDNVTLEDVNVHYQKTHRTPNMRFVIAGNITGSRKEVIEKVLGNIELSNEGHRIPLPDETPVTQEGVLYIENKSVENIYFYMDTFARRRVTDSEVYALMLANVLLTETLHSRIYGQAREKGLVYGVSSNYSRLLGSTNLWVGAQVLPKNIEPLFKIITREINQLKQGLATEEELKMAKLYALGRYQRSAQTVSSTAGLYSSRYFYEEATEDFNKVPEKIQAVTKAQLEEALHAVFSEKIRGFGLLGSCGQEFADHAYGLLDSLWQMPKES